MSFSKAVLKQVEVIIPEYDDDFHTDLEQELVDEFKHFEACPVGVFTEQSKSDDIHEFSIAYKIYVPPALMYLDKVKKIINKYAHSVGLSSYIFKGTTGEVEFITVTKEK